GDEVGPDAALHQLGQDLGGVAEEADRHGLLLRRVSLHAGERVVEVARLLVEVAGTKAEVDPALLAFDGERHGPGEGRGERLRAAHAAEPRRQDPAAREAAAVVLPPRLDDGLV